MRLNRRLAPEAYLGVEPVTRHPAFGYRIGRSGKTVDWAVHMRRLPEENRADRLVERGDLTESAVDQLAAQIADFHRRARCDDQTSRHGTVERIAANIAENFEQTSATISLRRSPRMDKSAVSRSEHR